ncbi:MAG TPA: hypothetical protein VFM48_16060 [Aquabacterium sp.]|nr:hypothetical protein [Aquabacterium sp.]
MHRFEASKPWSVAALLIGIAAATQAHAATQLVDQIGGLNKAENAIQTTTGRTFVSTQGALYEVTQSATGSRSATPLPVALSTGASSCYFTGLTEYASTLYATCAENTLLPGAPKHLLALDLTQPGTKLVDIASLHDYGFPNGLASDGAGHLYYANTTLLSPGAVWRITLSGRFAVSQEQEFYKFPFCTANGMKFWQNRLYVGANPPTFIGESQLLRYDVTASGLNNKAIIYTSWNVIDDFELVQGGLVVAEYLGNKVSHITENGTVLHTASFSSPTSAHLVWDNARGQQELLVTEAGANRASWLTTDWRLQAR